MAAYRFDVYHRPEGARQPLLFETYRISARDDSDAIVKAEQIFLAHETPSVTGFILRALGVRSADDRLVHNYVKQAGAFE
jgi:hypothetical protein